MSRAPVTVLSGHATVPSDSALDISSPRSDRVTLGGMGLRPVFIVGLVLILLFFGGFGTWAALAPLETAAIAPGRIVVESYSKVVQHLEGGIVGKILVTEGATVQEGDPVIVLDETQPGSQLGVVSSRLHHDMAREARLIAERDKLAKIPFPPDLLAVASQNRDVAEILDAQRRIFLSRKESIESQTSILQQRIMQYREEIRGTEAEIVADAKQLNLIKEELSDVEFLVKKGLERRPRLLALQRQSADIEGSKARGQSAVARSKQAIAEAQLRIVDLTTQMNADVVKELREVQSEIADLTQQRRTAEDVLKRTIVRAPVSGTVVKLKFHTIGGVVAPREPLMEIVPEKDKLIVEAQVNPNDIDVVHIGLPAQVRLSAYSTRLTPTLEGHVEQLSADRLQDERTGAPYYSARVLITEGELEKLKNVKLYPGMPAEVMIIAGQRTPLSYLMRPLVDSFQRSMRED